MVSEEQYDADIDKIYREIAEDRRRITRLEARRLRPANRDRARLLWTLIKSSENKRLPASDARRLLGLSKSQLSQVLAVGHEEFGIVLERSGHDRRYKILMIKE